MRAGEGNGARRHSRGQLRVSERGGCPTGTGRSKARAGACRREGAPEAAHSWVLWQFVGWCRVPGGVPLVLWAQAERVPGSGGRGLTGPELLRKQLVRVF